MSSTAPVQDAQLPPQAEPAPLVDQVDEYDDAEKNFQPKSPRFWIIIIGMYLSIFLVALVSIPRAVCYGVIGAYALLGPNNHRNCHPKHH